MGHLMEIVTTYNIEIIFFLAAGFFILLLLNIISQIRISTIKSRYNEIVRGIDNIDVEELLVKTGKDIEDIYININVLQKNLENLETKQAFAIQKIGFVRYNAFAEMGNELSFSIALLDSFKNGFVLTSIYGRDYTTSYGKPIRFGKSKYPLSVEEI